MKKMKLTPMHIALVLVVLCGLTTGAYSYMFKKTNTISNEFIPGFVSCEVIEVTDKNPMTNKSDVKVLNTGNIDAYVRVRFVSYWVNEHGAVVAKPSVMPDIEYDLTNWVKGSNDTYYYKTKIAPNSETSDLLKNEKVILLSKDDENNYFQVLDVFAEAIQAKPTNAVTSAWGVIINANGEITTAP